MPSPFPGMNPFLEQEDAWHDFHGRFLTLAATLITAQVRPKYIVRIDESCYVHEFIDNSRSFLGRPDIHIGLDKPDQDSGRSVSVLEPPTTVELLTGVDIERIVYLNIFDRKSRELVTVIELLSPTNKSNRTNRDQYLAKRERVLSSHANLVEIDLLRGGGPMPAHARPTCDYSVLVYRSEEWPRAGFWPIRLEDRLPIIPIPLLITDQDAQLDLQSILHQVYDDAAYEETIYQSPPEPRLTSSQVEWASRFLPIGRD